jgi:LysM repeat protein
MIKRLSMTAALVVAALFGSTVGLSVPAGALSLSPSYVDPVSRISHPLEHSQPIVYKTYKVKDGNTLSQIAHRFDLSWKKLYCANKRVIGKKPDVITPGMKLKVRESHRVWCSIAVEQAKGNISSTRVVSAPIQQSAPQPQQNYSGGSSFQQCVIMAESGGNPTAFNTSSGASGLYGFLLSTWLSLNLGYPGGASTAPVSVQNEGFAIEYARAGTAPWAPYDGC